MFRFFIPAYSDQRKVCYAVVWVGKYSDGRVACFTTPIAGAPIGKQKMCPRENVSSRVGDCHACRKTAKAPARMPLASARALATWWA